MADEPIVVPYVGTWIEIFTSFRKKESANVVPYVGTWIEIIQCTGYA